MQLGIDAPAPADLFITEALDRRPRSDSDYVGEARAIQAFAVGIANDPGLLLPHYVALALKLTGAGTGGLSLLEPEPAPGVFRWHFLQGRLSAFNGATTPRDFSPCGVTLDRDEPLLTRHPERFYSWIAEAGIEAPEVLLVPLRRKDGDPFGTLWVVSEVEGAFTRDHALTLGEVAEYANVAAAEFGGRLN